MFSENEMQLHLEGIFFFKSFFKYSLNKVNIKSTHLKKPPIQSDCRTFNISFKSAATVLKNQMSIVLSQLNGSCVPNVWQLH